MQRMIHDGIKEVYSPTELVMRAFCYTNSDGRMSSTAITRSEGCILLHITNPELFQVKRLKQGLKADKSRIRLQHYTMKTQALAFHLCHH